MPNKFVSEPTVTLARDYEADDGLEQRFQPAHGSSSSLDRGRDDPVDPPVP